MKKQVLNAFEEIKAVLIFQQPSGDDTWPVRLIPKDGKVIDTTIHELELSKHISSIRTELSHVTIEFEHPVTLYLHSYDGQVWLEA